MAALPATAESAPGGYEAPPVSACEWRYCTHWLQNARREPSASLPKRTTSIPIKAFKEEKSHRGERESLWQTKWNELQEIKSSMSS